MSGRLESGTDALTSTMQQGRLLSDAMMDCRMVPGRDEVTIHQGGRAPCFADVTEVIGRRAERHLAYVHVQSAMQNNGLKSD